MHARLLTLLRGSAMLLPFTALLAPALQAQDDGPPPNVILLHREYLKPGKSGLLHERSESAFVRTYSSGQPNASYFAMDALSGAPRTLFFETYSSFTEWGKMNAAIGANTAKVAALDRATLLDGDLLASADVAALQLRPDLSFNKGHIRNSRFFEITTFVVKPGHRHDFSELAHLYADAYRKAAPDAHWDCFELVYGSALNGVAAGSTFVVMNTMESMAEVDKGLADSDKVAAALGTKGMEKLEALTALSVEATTTNLFEINPRISNPPKEWISWEPQFWKAPVPAARKAAAKTEAP